MVVSHRYDFQRPSIKRTAEGVATMSGNIVSVDEESLKLCLVKPDFRVWGCGGNPGPFGIRRLAPNPSDTASGSCSPGRFSA